MARPTKGDSHKSLRGIRMSLRPHHQYEEHDFFIRGLTSLALNCLA